MNRNDYYEAMKSLARETRARFDLVTPVVKLSDLRRIYKDQGIRIDLWAGKLKNLRGAYFLDEAGPSVMLSKQLPKEQRIFTMGHELKHHLVDRAETNCMELEGSSAIEIGAEVFAAELIFPEGDFADVLHAMQVPIGACTGEHIVRLKHDTGTTMSFTGLAKRATRLRFAAPGALDGVQWKKLDVEIFGEPLYKRLQRRRAAAGRLRT